MKLESDELQITELPCLSFKYLNAEFFRLYGFSSKKILRFLKLLNEFLSNKKENLTLFLDLRSFSLINQDDLVIFIKGTPENPKCGFTKKLLDLFRMHKIQNFCFFDILADESIRTHIKTFSNWPTFPQVYWRGTLLGGLDIINDMIINKEFPADAIMGI